MRQVMRGEMTANAVLILKSSKGVLFSARHMVAVYTL